MNTKHRKCKLYIKKGTQSAILHLNGFFYPHYVLYRQGITSENRWGVIKKWYLLALGRNGYEVHHGGVKKLLWLSSTRWGGCEGLANTDHNWDSIFLSETSVRDSTPTTLLASVYWVCCYLLLSVCRQTFLRVFVKPLKTDLWLIRAFKKGS